MRPASPIPEVTISERIARFVHGLRDADIPPQVRQRAAELMLDTTGVALAAATYPFARPALAGLAAFGAGERVVIGSRARLPLRDAVVMNGVLAHGLDYDDTHMQGVVHVSAGAFPCTLAMAAARGASGAQLLTAYVAGIEVAARLGMVARGALHLAGLHPTGLLAAFSGTIIAGRLLQLGAQQLAMAQGIALSTCASSSRQFNREAAWSKRLHPGWGSAAGITAAMLAREDFVGPRAAYEGDYGLYRAHLGAAADACDLAAAIAGLGEVWETARVAVKPIPACHLVHACADAAAALRAEHGLQPRDIVAVRARIPAEAVPVVAEPVERRKRPASEYAAQFSIHYAVACALARGRFGLRELEPAAYTDGELLALADRVEHEIDPQASYPRWFSGEVVVTTRDGRRLHRREEINRGAPERPITAADIDAKFRDNASLALTDAALERLRTAVLAIDQAPDCRALEEALAADALAP